MTDLKYDFGRVYLTEDSKGNLNGLSASERLEHLHILGNTGTGKSTLIWNMIIQDIINSFPGLIIDVFGQSQSGLLPYIPIHRIENVIYLSGNDFEKNFGISVKTLTDKDIKKFKEKISSMIDFLKIFDEKKFLVADMSDVSDNDDQRRLFANIFLDTYVIKRKEFVQKKKNFLNISPISLYIDEAQIFNAAELNAVIDMAKNLGICLVISHQFLNQLDPILQINIFSSFAQSLYLAVIEEDAERLSQTYDRIFDIEILKNPGKFFANFKRNFSNPGIELSPERLLAFDFEKYNFTNLLIKKY